MLGWNNRKRTFETLWNADLPSSFGRVTGTGVICCADELSRAIVLHAHQGWMSILYPPTVPALKPKEGEDWLNPWDPNRVKFTTVRYVFIWNRIYFASFSHICTLLVFLN